MKKANLRSDYIVKISKGSEEFLARVGYNKFNVLGVSSEKTWFPIDTLDDDLTVSNSLSGARIIEVYGRCGNRLNYILDTEDRELLWKREVPKYTLEELEKIVGHEFTIVGEPVKEFKVGARIEIVWSVCGTDTWIVTYEDYKYCLKSDTRGTYCFRDSNCRSTEELENALNEYGYATWRLI